MKKILITGANGQLGNEFRLLSEYRDNDRFTFVDIGELDLTNPSEVNHFFNNHEFDVIVNCAAYTAVDKAEEDEKMANMVNGSLVRTLAEKANSQNALLVHISTDFVFNGSISRPYVETDVPAPQSAYARSKLLGEKEFSDTVKKGFIIRTSWLYSEFGKNFVKTIMKYGKERGSLNVVFDQAGTPTYALDLAKAILAGIDSGYNFNNTGLFHFSNEGVASWYDFAVAIIELSGINCKVYPIEAIDYPLPAIRPSYSVMNKAKIKKAFNIDIPYWRDSLRMCIEKMEKQN